jgi:hypothetical protein
MMKIRDVIMLLAVVSASSLLATSMSNPISLMFSLFIGIDRSDLFIDSYASTQNITITSNGNGIIIEEGKYIRKDITFPCSDIQCSGWLYLPSDLQPGEKVPGIVTANPITSIKQLTS